MSMWLYNIPGCCYITRCWVWWLQQTQHLAFLPSHSFRETCQCHFNLCLHLAVQLNNLFPVSSLSLKKLIHQDLCSTIVKVGKLTWVNMSHTLSCELVKVFAVICAVSLKIKPKILLYFSTKSRIFRCHQRISLLCWPFASGVARNFWQGVSICSILFSPFPLMVMHTLCAGFVWSP